MIGERTSIGNASKSSRSWGWGTFDQAQGETKEKFSDTTSVTRKSGMSASLTSGPVVTVRSSLTRARLGSGDLLHRELSGRRRTMSPAMHRRRELSGLGNSGCCKGKDEALPRLRSNTSDEHGIKAQRQQRLEGWSWMERRDRVWSHETIAVPMGRLNPAAEWEHLDAFQAMSSLYQQELYHEKSKGLVEMLSERLQVPLLMVLVGVLAAIAGMVVDYCSSAARIWRISQTAAHTGMPHLFLAYGSISLSLALTMCAITHYICPCAAGGGVPEMKAVLSGASRPGLLSPRLVVVKMLGVIVATAAGLSVGKEGPLIHVTCAMADILMTTRMFRKVRMRTMKRLEILACACAAGVAATFGSVFGGTLFSVEVTATAYMVDTLPPTFFCAVVVALVYWSTGSSELFTLISDNTAQAEGFTAADLVAWALLGTVCGLVGAVFVAVLDSLSKLRNHFIRKDLDERTRRRRVFVVVALCTLLVIPASYLEAVGFSEEEPRGRERYRPVIDKMYDSRVFGVSWYLYTLLALKVWTTVFSVVQPLPVGLFSPIFIIGGVMGRIFGELVRYVDQEYHIIDINFQPWEFALIGSAAFSAGVTRAVSTAVIVFELSGENHLRLPLGVALMISYFIAQRFTKGVYDALMDTNGTPYMQEVPPKDRNVPAEEVMIPVEDIPCLSLNSTGKEAADLASSCEPGQVIPVVQSMHDKVLVGVVLLNDLAIAIADYEASDRGTSPHLPSSTNANNPGLGAAGLDVSGSSAGRGGTWGWQLLMVVGEAIKGRMGWNLRSRMARRASSEPLNYLTLDEGVLSDEEVVLSPLGPGIPWKSPAADGGGGGGNGNGDGLRKTDGNGSGRDAAAVVDPQHSGAKGFDEGLGGRQLSSRMKSHFSTPDLITGDATPGAVEPPRSVRDASGSVEDSPAPGGGGGGMSSPRRKSRAQRKHRAAQERANHAPLRFYLVREGHKFVQVGRTKGRPGGWRELGSAPKASRGVDVVLDPSPYQVTHTTELSKVDIAFRLLRLDNAYVCNAGRLVGVVTRDSLRIFVAQREVKPMDDCISLFPALSCCFPRRVSDSSDNANTTINTKKNSKRLAWPSDKSKNNGGLFNRMAGRRSPATTTRHSFATTDEGWFATTSGGGGGAGEGEKRRWTERWPLSSQLRQGYSSLTEMSEGDVTGKEGRMGDGPGWDPV